MELHVRVVEATDLPKMDLFGKADPYCILQISDRKEVRKTKVIESTYSPVWNEEFHFIIINPSTSVLKILMKDRDIGCADDPISRIEIPIASLTLDSITDKWYDMRPVKGVKKGGRLRLVLHLANAGMTPFRPINTYTQPMYATQTIPMYPQQPMMGQPMMGQPMMGNFQQPMMGNFQQPMMGQPMMGQPMMGNYQQPMMGQPMMGQPMMGNYQQPMMGQPMMGQPMMGQPMMGQPMMGQGMMRGPY